MACSFNDTKAAELHGTPLRSKAFNSPLLMMKRELITFVLPEDVVRIAMARQISAPPATGFRIGLLSFCNCEPLKTYPKLKDAALIGTDPFTSRRDP